MDFDLNAEQLAYQDRVRQWVSENLPRAPKPPPGREEPPASVRERYNAWQAIRHGTQIHGAIGVTEEHDMHLFAKRAKTLGISFGSLAHCHEIILRQGGPPSTGGG